MNRIPNYKFVEKALEVYFIIESFKINKDLSVNAINVAMRGYSNLTKIPIKFNEVGGYFNCSRNKLTTLVNSPNVVNGSFWCIGNKLSSLYGISKIINGSISFTRNNIPSFEYLPETVTNISCESSQLYSFDGVSYEFLNKVISSVIYDNNPVCNLIEIFNNEKTYIEYLNDYSFQKGNIIYIRRFTEALSELNIKIIQNIKNYKYV